ncbi:MAG: hypothetical protein LBR60_01045 [Fibrobacter sp.]|jgi:uncharacterized protein (TIGR02145 family)|nr:hypothetical protein [Fibrobacter sp.]
MLKLFVSLLGAGFFLAACGDDLQREYYPDKKVKSEARYVNGVKQGPEKEFYESGALKAETGYEAGVRSGLSKTFFENGKIRSEVPYENDQMEGTLVTYYENGNIKSKTLYRKNVPADFPETFDTDGAPAASGSFKDSRDRLSYEWVRIQNQIWLAQNMNFAPVKGSVCAQCNVWGRLYNFESAKIACPEYFRMPSEEDWNTLLKNTAPESGKNLKASFGWDPVFTANDYGNGTDAFGFAARAGGGHFASAEVPVKSRKFENAGRNAYFWVDDGRVLVLSHSKPEAEFRKFNPEHGASLRCVRTVN